ncbi:MAG TPA: type II toxin-antitoxin system VapC family toxin [Povalibacter sp.]|uniref:type II toxin-antitoxin system VapC family toxin n=1 Tax=Povalibacter sp. TaxID=1962978 RepID=UPI002D154064|nr:type II toxin-antitoxin system VapC family toxin [Povalibacter sp.]HMN47092.1 type II toxin-antitoxin system VapC family toxin [Povalibacter sp.]
MRLLLDTHAFLWWLAGDEALPARAREAIGEAQTVYVSAASVWEIATKHRIGKLPGVSAIVGSLPTIIADEDFAELPISARHAEAAGLLPGPHRDPFDRMLIAQARIEEALLVSNEAIFDAYGAQRLW